MILEQLSLLLCTVVMMIHGHGRLINPPGRSTMWRYGFDTPRNSDDHQLSCGGFGVQYYRNDGKCGVCGDRYDGPRDNEAGGKYATGTIAQRYNKGEVITVQVEITVNHGGWFEFHLCPVNNKNTRAKQDCLDKWPLKQVNGEENFKVPLGLGIATVQLRLPEDLTCSQCVLQWKWITASNVRCDSAGCCRGCGPQEQFYGCSDIAILPGRQAEQFQKFTIPYYLGNVLTTRRPIGVNSGAVNTGTNSGVNSGVNGNSVVNIGANSGNAVNGAPDSFIPVVAGGANIINNANSGSATASGSNSASASGTNGLPSGIVVVPSEKPKCTATKEYSSPAWNDWCLRTCNSGDDCPKDICSDECRQGSECRAKEFFRSMQTNPWEADRWCMERCSGELCPLDYCEVSCWT